MLNRYKVSLVQFHNIFTKEILNIGVVLQDKDSYYYHIPQHYDKLKNCIDFTEISGIKYTIDIIIDRIKNQNRLSLGEVSNSIKISEPKTFKSELASKDALFEAVDKYMMIHKFKSEYIPKKADKYDKLSILSGVQSMAERKGYKHFQKHHRYQVAQKIIDMALLDKDKMPYSIANLASIYKDDFDDTFIKAKFTLEEAMRNDVVKDGFLYAPIYKDVSLSLEKRKLIDWAKEEAKYMKVDFITNPSEESVLERLNQYELPKEQQLVLEEL